MGYNYNIVVNEDLLKLNYTVQRVIKHSQNRYGGWFVTVGSHFMLPNEITKEEQKVQTTKHQKMNGISQRKKGQTLSMFKLFL